jgi:Fe-S-cluster containining protein
VTPLDVLTSLPEEKRLWFERRLQGLYAEMDAAYDAVASGHGFHCTGCADNCCLTRFHHHTMAELALLQTAFSHLPKVEREAAAGRATVVLTRYESAEKTGESPRVMCPVNLEQHCLIYDARPMICRMHGVPHVLRGPGRPPSYGPGCAAFSERCESQASGPVFDRTPYYQKMAVLEKELRTAARYTGKIKMTVAEMILLFSEEVP